jgi:hypothetical protein
MSTPTLAAQRSPSRPLNWRALLIAGVIVAVIAAVTALVLTPDTATKAHAPAWLVAPTPAVAAHGFGIDHPLPHAVIQNSALSSGMGHR